MGTPGDKAEIGKVVLDPEQETAPSTTTPPTTDSATIGVVPHFPQPSTSTSTDMGLVSRRSQFETFSALNLHPSLSQAATKPESFQEGLVAAARGQARIEDYYAQAKYYPSVSENLQASASPTTQIKQPPISSTFLLDQQPGPSGLQTSKSKTTSATSTIAGKSGTKKGKGKQHQPQKKTHSCPVCQKCFASADKLQKHQQVHTGTSQFKCEHCKKSFTSKFKLVRHVLIHSDRKPFSCTVCERTFHRKDHLKNHIKVHSPSKKVHVCDKADCKKEYTSLMSYRKHLALHAAEEGSLVCQICSDTFTTKEQILYHLKVHAGSRTVKNPSEKKFTCEICSRKFFTKKDVRRHLVVHTGMRDFLCQFCPQRFGRKDHLVRHIKKSHSKNVTAEDLETAIKSETSERAPETVVKEEEASTTIKMEDVKAEYSESSLSNPESFFAYDLDMLERTSFDELGGYLPSSFIEPATSSDDLGGSLEFLPSTSAQAEQFELLHEIGESSSAHMMMGEPLSLPPPTEIIQEGVLVEPFLEPSLHPTATATTPQTFTKGLESTEQKKGPLPGFSQTFQSQPPP